MRKNLVVFIAVVLGCCSGPVLEIDPKRIEPEASVKLPDFFAAAAPWLIHRYGQERFESEVRPQLERLGPSEAVRLLENQLLETQNLHEIYYLAGALGALKRPESKRVLLKKLGGARGGPKRGGVVFGGDKEVAHYSLIWALAQVEGQTFEGSPDHFSALMDWWMNYPIADQQGRYFR